MKIPTTIQLTKIQFKQLKKKSSETGNSVSSIIRQAIEEYLCIDHNQQQKDAFYEIKEHNNESCQTTSSFGRRDA